METRFKIRIEQYRWSCGDGCCSDSGFRMEALDTSTNLLVDEESEWDYHKRWGRLVERALEKISKIVPNPIKDVDYSIYFVTVEDEQEYDAYDLEWLRD